jgi:hypothetical protein
LKGGEKMTGGQMFILVFLIGGALSGAIFMMGLGVYDWGKGLYDKNQKDKN